MAEVKQRTAAKKFVEDWTGKGYEKGESQKFWLQLLGEVLGVEHPAQFISFEDQVHLDHTSFIDGYIPATKVLIEQKSVDKDLNMWLIPVKEITANNQIKLRTKPNKNNQGFQTYKFQVQFLNIAP